MAVIEVDNISKKYNIHHINNFTLREKVVFSLKSIAGRQKDRDKNFQGFWALKDINFKVKRGEILGIIGPNGAGKSTLLKILAKITPPTAGRIKLKGKVASLLEVGTGFHPELSGRENIYLNGSILGMSKIEINKKINEIIEFSGVEKFIDMPIKHYSSGMSVRLAFSIAAHLNPEILLIDEVLAVGDVEFQEKCIGKMNKMVKNSGKTIIFVSHNLAAIRNLCQKCLLLMEGRINNIGDVDSVIERYINLSNKSFQDNVSKFHKKEKDDRGKLAFFNNLKIKDKSGDEAYVFFGGQNIVFEVEIFSNIDNLKCEMALAIRDSFGNLVINLINTDYKKEIILSRGLNSVFIELKNNFLSNGIYMVSLWLGEGVGNNIIYDYVKNISNFRIENYNRGNFKSAALLLPESEWKFAKN